LVSHAFERLLTISRAQKGIIGEAAIEWAALQVTDLIEREDRFVDCWIKSACDGKNDAPRRDATLEDSERRIFWTDWRAPQFLYMEPNGNFPYDATTAWERMDEGESKSALKAFREGRWILLLKSTLDDLAGTAHEVFARQENSSTSQSQQRQSELVPPVAEKNPLSTLTLPVQVTSEGPQISRPTTTADRSTISGALLLNYRSELKRAVLIQLTQNPNGTDLEICRGLDADGSAELPAGWNVNRGDRSFAQAYSNREVRHKIEIAISRVRADLRDAGLLPRR